VLTTAFPALTRHARAGSWSAFADEVGRATRAIVWFTTISAGALIALAGPLSHLVAYGNASGRYHELALAIAGFAVGLPAFSLVLFLVRVAYSYGDTRSPAVVALVMVVLGSAAMVATVQLGSGADRIALIGVGYAVAQCVGLVGLAAVVRGHLHRQGARVHHLVVPVCRSAGAAAIASVAVGVVVARLDPTSRIGSFVAVVVGGASLLALAVLLGWLAGGPGPKALVSTLGAHPGRRVAGATPEDRAAAEQMVEEIEREAGQ